jgi:hypothetical protein
MVSLEEVLAHTDRAYDKALLDISGDWDEIFRKPEFVAYRKTTSLKLYAMKFEILLSQPPQEVIDTLFDNWLAINQAIQGSDYKEGQILSHYNADTQLIYEVFSVPVPFISDRVLLTAASRRQVTEGVWVKIDTSVTHPSYPEDSLTVRAELSYAVHVCEGLPDGGTVMTVAGLGDIKGYIPKFVVNFGLTMRVKNYYKVMKRLKRAPQVI